MKRDNKDGWCVEGRRRRSRESKKSVVEMRERSPAPSLSEKENLRLEHLAFHSKGSQRRKGRGGEALDLIFHC